MKGAEDPDYHFPPGCQLSCDDGHEPTEDEWNMFIEAQLERSMELSCASTGHSLTRRVHTAPTCHTDATPYQPHAKP